MAIIRPSSADLDKARRQTDWGRIDGMTDAELTANAESDPDNPPLTDAQLARLRPAPDIAAIRNRLGLTQKAFADRFAIPLGLLRDWEQGRRSPDHAARAYLAVIANDPEAVVRALRAA